MGGQVSQQTITNVRTRMASSLAASEHEIISDMIHSVALSISQMEQAAGCHKSPILRVSSNLRMFDSVKALPNKAQCFC